MTFKIATIGSFITNDSFKTTFNPYYQQFFDVVLQESESTLIDIEAQQSFFKGLKDTEPQYLIVDFSLDILNGWMTNNEGNSKQPWDKYGSFERYFENWQSGVQHFLKSLKNKLPSCQVLLVHGRLAESFTDDLLVNDYCKQHDLSSLDINTMNQQWETFNDYFCQQHNVELLDLTKRNYLFERSKMQRPTDFHYEAKFYNYFLNQLVALTYQQNVMAITQEKTVQRMYLDEENELLQTKQIEVVTGSETNLIKLARKGGYAYRLYKMLLKNDYILYFHTNGYSKLHKRKYVNELWQRKDLNRVGDTFYTLDAPKDRKDNPSNDDKKLIVIFSCMPGADTYDSHLIGDRMFKKLFDGIERSLVKNVYTMRVMDLNLSHGSHFINSINNPTMEQDICDAIVEVKEKLGLQDKDIVLYGVSKGGTGALYYGAKLDLKSLAVDPIISLGEYNRNDTHFLKDFRKVDISDDINTYLSQGSHFEKYIIGSENVPFNYEHISKIHGANVIKMNKKDAHIKTHPDVSPNTIPEQLMLLNKMLLDMKFMMVNI
ncbi:accessory Sec system protein Asp2 [Staphylococcus rostri]|nr:accessory Sec system protein Asp2 [Staphylococcus rostri]